LADGCNLATDESLDRKIAVLRRHCDQAGRDQGDVAVTVLDLPVVGRDRDEVWSRVEQLRGRTAAATFARSHHAGTYAEQRQRYSSLAEKGVRTVFLALGHVQGADDVLALAPMIN
ncbi:MAG: luciferase, partial [Actinomycetota bacterium]|nr:luciferase [Actinomycetota bacterium]